MSVLSLAELRSAETAGNGKTAEFPWLNRIIKGDCVAALENLPENSVDTIFADPPYDVSEAYLERLVSLCTEGDLMEEGGVLIIEHSPHRDLSGLEGFQETRKYGSTLFTFFRA